MEQSTSIFVLKIVALMVAIFASLPFIIMFSIAKLGGWSVMAANYGSSEVISKHKWQTGQSFAFRRFEYVPANYTNTGHFFYGADALYIATPAMLRLFHQPLKVPYADMSVEIRPSKFSDMTVVTFKHAEGVEMVVRRQDMKDILTHLNAK